MGKFVAPKEVWVIWRGKKAHLRIEPPSRRDSCAIEYVAIGRCGDCRNWSPNMPNADPGDWCALDTGERTPLEFCSDFQKRIGPRRRNQ